MTADSSASIDASVAPPFFLVGCVRSGTTLLRDLLRRHPNLACPEETHFYRWGEPMGTQGLRRMLATNPVLREHRKLDGISEEEFVEMLTQEGSRAELYERYMRTFIQRRKPAATRWFDKTPQNVYGALLMATSMPKSRFVNIVRHPLNVVASLRLGKVIKVESLIGAINYWNEADHIMRGLKRAYPSRVLEMRYEDLMRQPDDTLRKLMRFIGEPYDAAWFRDHVLQASDHREAQVLSAEEAEQVKTSCRRGMRRHGYLPADAASLAEP